MEAVRQRSRPNMLLLVEGVGGLLCPLTETETVADLAAALELPLVVVARRSLGTLNHTLLTIEVAQHRCLTWRAWWSTRQCHLKAWRTRPTWRNCANGSNVPILAVVPHQTDLLSDEIPGWPWWIGSGCAAPVPAPDCRQAAH